MHSNRQIRINNIHVNVIKDSSTAFLSRVASTRSQQAKHGAFFVGDVDDIIHKYRTWSTQLPRVHPFYAVKCNDDPVVLGVLAKLGTGFDCASKNEIKKVLDLGVSPSRIIYAHPCKKLSYIRFAAENGVEMMTFDNREELHKVKSVHPNAKMILRIVPPDNSKSHDTPKVSTKFGCQPKDAVLLLRVARQLKIDVVGVSFYMGLCCMDSSGYKSAIEAARRVFDVAAEEGFCFTILDIGGGFDGSRNPSPPFDEVASVLRQSFDQYFPEKAELRIIAEPGGLFVASAFTLVTNVTSAVAVTASEAIVNDHVPDGNSSNDTAEASQKRTALSYTYHLNDGIHGSFGLLFYANIRRQPFMLNAESDKRSKEPTYRSTLWGPALSGVDCVLETCYLPRLDVGDWLLFEDMGAYTITGASDFNGMPRPKRFYVISEEQAEQFADE